MMDHIERMTKDDLMAEVCRLRKFIRGISSSKYDNKMIPLPNDLDSSITPGTSWIEFFIRGYSAELLEQSQLDRNDADVFTAFDMRLAATAKLLEYEKISEEKKK